MIFSPDATCRPFDSEARGTRAGAGVGIVVLKRLDDALADRDTIHAVILGAAINNDGAGEGGLYGAERRRPGRSHRDGAGARRRRSAHDRLRRGARNGHAARRSDRDRARSRRPSAPATDAREFCAIGSVKANIGHLDAAAGVDGLIKTVLALEHAELPPLVHFRSPNPQLALDTSPFRVPTQVRTVAPRRHTAPRWRELVRHRRHECARRPRGGARAGRAVEPARSARADRLGEDRGRARARDEEPGRAPRRPIRDVDRKTSRTRCRSGAARSRIAVR